MEQCNYCLQVYNVGAPHNCRFINNYSSLKTFLLVYECDRCGKLFSGMSNSGMHKCKYHPGIIGRDGKWTCCGGGRSQHTNPAVYNAVWTREHQIRPPIISLKAGCTPCDHSHNDSPIKLPLDPNDPNRIHLLAHLDPPAKDRPGWDGTQLWPYPTYSTAEFQIAQEEKSIDENEANDVMESITEAEDEEDEDDEEDEEDEEFA